MRQPHPVQHAFFVVEDQHERRLARVASPFTRDD
jgi:hypothetical protein